MVYVASEVHCIHRNSGTDGDGDDRTLSERPINIDMGTID